jgi:hypothetical protein
MGPKRKGRSEGRPSDYTNLWCGYLVTVFTNLSSLWSIGTTIEYLGSGNLFKQVITFECPLDLQMCVGVCIWYLFKHIRRYRLSSIFIGWHLLGSSYSFLTYDRRPWISFSFRYPLPTHGSRMFSRPVLPWSLSSTSYKSFGCLSYFLSSKPQLILSSKPQFSVRLWRKIINLTLVSWTLELYNMI